MTAHRTGKIKHNVHAADLKASRRITLSLTPRERQVLRLLVHGYTSRQIGDKLGISPRTAGVHRINIGRRLRLRKLAQMVRYAIENKL